MPNINDAPRLVNSPDGSTLAPVRVIVADDTLTIEDREGQTLVTATVTTVSGGTRITTIDTDAGRFTVRKLCSCSSSQRRYLAEWQGDQPRREGT